MVEYEVVFLNKSFLKEQDSKEYKTFAFDKGTDAVFFLPLLILIFFISRYFDAWHITNKDLENIRIDFADFGEDARAKLSCLYLILKGI